MPAEILLAAADLPDCWKTFAARHSDKAFLTEGDWVFASYWPQSMLAALEGALTRPSAGLLSLTRSISETIRQDTRLEINTPVRDPPSSSRGPHLDTPNRLFSGLFYLLAVED